MSDFNKIAIQLEPINKLLINFKYDTFLPTYQIN